MNRKSVKISAGQMYVLLLLARIMHTMIFHARSVKIGTPVMLTLALTTVLELLLAIPALILFRDGGCDAAREIAGESKAAFVIRLAYTAYFLFISSGTLMYFAEFIRIEFQNVAPPAAVAIVLAAAAAYCAYLGIEGIARAGTVVLWAFLILFITMAAVSEGEFDTLNLLPVTQDDFPKMLEYAIRDLSSSWWLPMLICLGPYLKDGVKKTVFGYLISKLIILETLMLLVTLVLWSFVDVIGYPMLALGAYAKTDFIQNFDAINMFVWCLNCVIVNGAYLFISAKTFGQKHRLTAVLACGAAAAAGAIISFENNFSYNDGLTFAIKLIGIVLLGTAVPAAAITARKRRARRSADNMSQRA